MDLLYSEIMGLAADYRQFRRIHSGVVRALQPKHPLDGGALAAFRHVMQNASVVVLDNTAVDAALAASALPPDVLLRRMPDTMLPTPLWVEWDNEHLVRRRTEMGEVTKGRHPFGRRAYLIGSVPDVPDMLTHPDVAGQKTSDALGVDPSTLRFASMFGSRQPADYAPQADLDMTMGAFVWSPTAPMTHSMNDQLDMMKRLGQANGSAGAIFREAAERDNGTTGLGAFTLGIDYCRRHIAAADATDGFLHILLRDLLDRFLYTIGGPLLGLATRRGMEVQHATDEAKAKYNQSAASVLVSDLVAMEADLRFLLGFGIMWAARLAEERETKGTWFRRRRTDGKKVESPVVYRTLTVDMPRLHARAARVGAPLGHDRASPREHGVIGHWQHRANTGRDRCPHEWEAVLGADGQPVGSQRQVCRRCGRIRWWRDGFRRGDASRGQVVKTYRAAMPRLPSPQEARP